ncbi:MAG TPA: YggT family protein [Gammaproteobacteria bacterium]|jgi:YggT family protein
MIASRSLIALVFVINTLFGIYTGAVLLRFLMQQVRADFYNPLAQAVMKITNPPLLPLRRVIRPWRRIDLASLVLAALLQLVNVTLVIALADAQLLPAWGYLIYWTVLKLLFILVNLYFFSVLLEALTSWLNQGRSPLDGLLRPLNAPLLRPARRIIPPVNGLDFSPLLVMLVLQVINILIPLAWPIV